MPEEQDEEKVPSGCRTNLFSETVICLIAVAQDFTLLGFLWQDSMG